jgi:hypothetical protein
MVAPLFILAPHRSFTSVTCAMLGQHPQMYGLPETNLFVVQTMWEWWTIHDQARSKQSHGLLRAVAQLVFGEQTRETIEFARWWLRRRLGRSTESVYREILDRTHPLIIVEKSPLVSYRPEVLDQLHQEFPEAKFLHLLRHPRGHGQSVIKLYLEFGVDPMWIDWWLSSGNDPQDIWYSVNKSIQDFLGTLRKEQGMRIRGEDLFANPDPLLHGIAEWLGIRTDSEAIDGMKHPERSPFAFFGPLGGRLGYDPHFLMNPKLRLNRRQPHNLEGPVDWRDDGEGFSPHIKQLARDFGYD